jgi:hypothetical protein
MAFAPQEMALPGLYERLLLALVDVHEVTMIDRKLDVVTDQALEISMWVCVTRSRGRDQFLDRLVEQRGENLVLTLEMSIQSWPADANALADLVDPNAVEALLVEQGGRSIKYLSFTSQVNGTLPGD